MDQHILLARQPIYDKALSLFGYELLFRHKDNLEAWVFGEENATYEVIVNYCTSMSDEIDLTIHPLFINVSDAALLEDPKLPLAKNFVVFELLERLTVTPDLIKTVANLHSEGYRFALDDFEFGSDWDPLIPYAEFIKVDVLDRDLAEIEKLKNSFEDRFEGKWLAERVEDHETLDACAAMGFELFQGYVLSRPKEIVGNTVRGSATTALELAQLTSNPNACIEEITQIVSKDPKLTIQILKIINSPMVNLQRPIKDIKEAVMFLGLDKVRSWAIIIGFISSSETSKEAIQTILARAKCCEFYTEQTSQDNEKSSEAFLAGIISGLDTLLAFSPNKFVESMPLSDSIKNAVLGKDGDLTETINHSKLIEFCLAQRQGDMNHVPSKLLGQYAKAQSWACGVMSSID